MLINQRTAELQEKNKTITDSIKYAKQIQQAVIPSESYLKKYFDEIFVFYKARDIVSGDFYWFYQTNNYKYIVVGDCTGHGVPGAIMSMVGNTILTQTVSQIKEPLPSELLDALSKEIARIFKNKENSADGMDVSVIRISKNENKAILSLANTQAIYISENKLQNLEGDIYSIGGYFAKPDGVDFQNIEIITKPGDKFYLFTDGYTDQFGGDQNQKFGIKRFEKLLIDINSKPAQKQKHIIVKEFFNWKNKDQQIDDILVIGIKLS
jgi:serine phosphatase RsbU (regulator of sigma subunit)